jgi:lipoate-protein ligase A
MGIDAEFSGRNDILAGAESFPVTLSATAGAKACTTAQFFLTPIWAKLAGYLQVSKAKNGKQGVKSVSARVVNLCEN